MYRAVTLEVVVKWHALLYHGKGISDVKKCNSCKPHKILHLPYLLFKIASNISNTRDSVSSGYSNTEKRVENTTRSGVFLTKFEVFE